MNTNIETIMNLWKNANEEERETLSRMMSNINVNNRNNNKTKNFAEKIIKKQNDKKEVFVKFLESNSVNGVIYAPTQIGKSAATRAFIETCFMYNTPVIVSTDNKTDQQEQLYYRIERDLAGADVNLLKVSDKNFDKQLKNCIETKNKRFVIFCLDNSTQIEKIIVQLVNNYTRCENMKEIKKIAIIHDEADTIAKDKDTENKCETQAESHKKWLELRDLINTKMGEIELKRIFVTATPENCMMLYKVDCPDVMRLEIPSCYTGYDKIQHVALPDDLRIKELLTEEVKRINKNKTYEAILYCIDRKIVDGHERVLKTLATSLKCIVNTYNGNGITTYINSISISEKLERQLNKHEILFTKKENYYQMKNLSIRKFYTIIKKIGGRCVVTIGKDLICRGISYVGENQKEPITATTMFYKPGSTMYATGICQTIGRITGCAMPELPRKLYAPQDVYDTYLNYNKNQEMFIKSIEKADSLKITKDIIEELVFNKYTRNIDRMKLNLKMNMKTVNVESDIESENSDEEETVMSDLIDMWWGKRSIIGKLLNFIYENEDGVSEDVLKEYIKDCGSKNIDKMYKELIRKDKSFTLVFERKNNITKLNTNAREYIDEIM